MRCLLLRCSLISLLVICFFPAFCQLGTITFDIQKDKPEKFQNKKLKSETTGDKKFTLKRRISQNTVSHYNYYFNANNKLNEVIEKARLANKEDYGKLLPFYSYSLNTTAGLKTDLDSVIYKATAGILLHDLRSDWVDNFYLLIGKAYLLRKDFDSAGMTFQFINYNLFPRKKKGDDYPPIVGSNLNETGTVSIATKENRSVLDKAFTRPPSRNDALVWQVRTFIEQGEFTDASGLINTLQNDPNFPSRLKAGLEEVNAYWFYSQKIYDSAAVHLEKALSAADDKQDKSRWEYLLGQLYELSNEPAKASRYYTRAMHHTTDPMLDIYANLNNAKIYRSNDPKEFNNTISNLEKMARKDKYDNYRDIVYYSAGELALQKPDTAAAEALFLKSLSYNDVNTAYRNRSFLQLGDIAFGRKDYKKASAYYDSLDLNNEVLIDRSKEISERKNTLAFIVKKINIIEREDSLQRIAQMLPDQRDAYIKDMLSKMRRENGIKDEVITTASFNDRPSNDIFGGNNTKGDWYFYNPAVKSKGFSEFRSRWGNRINIDNWRRISSTGNNTTRTNNTTQPQNNTTQPVSDLTFDGMLANLPLSPEKLRASNDLLSLSLYELGQLYQNELEDYAMAVKTYEESLKRYPALLYNGELYLNLVYSLQKLGNQERANYYKNLLATAFKGSNAALAVTNPQALKGGADQAATQRYKNIYDLFIEGNFEKALTEKRAADSIYGNNYWSPQLLYIEAVYYIKQRQDTLALRTLNDIIGQYPRSPLREKAVAMIDVVTRRSQIESYLTNLNITRVSDDPTLTVNDQPQQKRPVTQPVIEQPKNDVPVQKPEEKKVITPQQVTPQPIGTFIFKPEEPQNVVMILNKVDAVYISEARNALNRYNRERSQNIQVVKDILDKDRTLLVFSPFTDANAAIAYTDALKKSAAAEISWLPASKYSFIVISDANLQLLKTNLDLQGYINLLNSKYPGRF